MPQQNILDFYERPAAMTFAGEYGAMLEGLPNDVGVLTGIVQGSVIHEYMASAYDVQACARILSPRAPHPYLYTGWRERTRKHRNHQAA